MRAAACIAVLALVACSSGGHGGVHDAGHDGRVALDGLSCAPAAGCATGAMCGTTCCAMGEACISGVCMCGSEPACTNGNMCAAPLVMSNRCGDICCGATTACPAGAGLP